MNTTRRALLAASALGALLPHARANAQTPTLKLGVLTDMSGPYRDLSGPGSTMSANLAIEEVASSLGLKVEVVSADHQNKPDVGVGVAKQWLDQDGVDAVLDVANSAVSLAIAGVCKEKDKVFLSSGGATSDLTAAACTPNTVHWTYDTYMLARSTGGALVKAGGDSWFFMTADYAFGAALERDVGNFVTSAGGKVVGGVKTPFPGTTDFSSFLLQGQSSGAKVLGLANAGSDTINSIKQAKEFGITMKLAGLLVFLTDVHSLGLAVAQGLILSESYYWDLNDGTRAFADRFTKRMPNVRPTMVQAGVYASTLHYLRAVAALGVAKAKASGAAAVAQMKAMPTDDVCFGKGSIRIDGRKIHPSYLFEVKKPSESKAPFDYYKLLATTPANEAFRPLSEGGCPLVKA
jgi:branched-chain amino acid transport system substrate-binding protein